MTGNIWKYWTIVGIAAASGYLALPSASSQAIAYVVIGACSVIGILAGVALHRPPDRLRRP